MFAQAPQNIVRPLGYSQTLHQYSSRESLEFMHSMIQKENELQAEGNRTLLSPLSNVGDERRYRSDRDNERARYAYTRGLAVQYLMGDWSQVWETRNRAGTDVWPRYLAAALVSQWSGVSLYSLSKTYRKLLQTWRGTVAQREHKELAVRDQKTPRYFFVATEEMIAHL